MHMNLELINNIYKITADMFMCHAGNIEPVLAQFLPIW